MQSAQQPAPKTHVRAALRSHVPAILVFALIGVVAAIGLSTLPKQQFTATSSVLIAPLDGNAFSPTNSGSNLVNLETEAQVAKSDVVINDVRQKLGNDISVDTLAKGIKVAIATNTQVLDLTYVSNDRDFASAAAAQFSRSFLDYRKSRRDTFIDSKRATLADRISSLEQRIDVLEARGTSTANGVYRAVSGQLLNLRLEDASLAAADISPGELLDAPDPTSTGLALPTWAVGLAGLLLGLLLGVAYAVLRERRADLVRTLEDVEDLGIVVLASLDPADRTEPGQPSDAARAAGNVVARRTQTPVSVAVANVGTGGAHGFGVELASVLSQGAEPTLLIDGSEGFGPTRDGLSEILHASRPLEKVVTPHNETVAYVGAGREPGVGEEYYATSRMTRLLDDAAQTYQWVVVESPSGTTTPGRAMVSACRYWIPVISLGHTTRPELARAIAWGETAGVTVLGAVVRHPGTPGRGDAKRASSHDG